MIGPFRAGRVNGVTGVPGQPNTFYFGSVGGGVWKTTNAGRTWTPIFDSQPSRRSARSPSRRRTPTSSTSAPARPTCATRSRSATACTSPPTPARRGRTSASTTRGRSAASSSIRAIPNVVFVAALGHVYGPNPDRGVYPLARRRRDVAEGALQERRRRRDRPGVRSGEPADRSTRRSGTRRRPPWSIYPPSYGPGSGLYKSTDGGTTWQPADERSADRRPRPHRDRGRAVESAAASTRSSTRRTAASIGRTTPARRGRRSSGDSRIWGRGWYFGKVTVDPKNADLVYVPNTGALSIDATAAGRWARRSRARPAATTITSSGSIPTIRTG